MEQTISDIDDGSETDGEAASRRKATLAHAQCSHNPQPCCKDNQYVTRNTRRHILWHAVNVNSVSRFPASYIATGSFRHPTSFINFAAASNKHPRLDTNPLFCPPFQFRLGTVSYHSVPALNERFPTHTPPLSLQHEDDLLGL